MKKIYYFLPIAAVALLSATCSQQKKEEPAMETKKFDIANLDTTVVPGDDFYKFATGGWAKANPIPDEYSRYGSFDALIEQNQAQIKGIIEDLAKTENKKGSIAQKIGDLYKMGMDSTRLNADGAKPIKVQLEEIAKAASTKDIIKLVGSIRQYATSPFFGAYVGADMKNSEMNIVQLGQGGLGLGEREYYLKQDTTTQAIRKGYVELIKKQFANAGYTQPDAEKAAESILKIETALAKTHYKKEDTRIPEKNYHKMAVTELDKQVAKFDWATFFDAAGMKGFTELDVNQIAPIAESVKIIQTYPIDETKAYLSWCVINSAASYLSDDFDNVNFDFYGKQLSGRLVQQPRWKRTVQTVDGCLSEALGQMYVEKYFPAAAKERMLNLVKNLQATLGERITNLTWMSNETKEKAKEKLNAFIIKIGYPDKWKDYSSLEIKDDSYWQNIVRASQFEYNENIAKIGKPVDRSEWHMPPQMVNAYYNPTTNEICFPAGILQPPFFYMEADDAVNYGAIGVVIGHEMSHGFDDQGCQFDKDGNFANWWTPEDSKKFNERSQVLVDHFNNIEVLPGLHANGVFTLGENIGDFGGLQVAYNAFAKTEEAKKGEKIDGFTPQQRFFLSYAGVWAGNIREQEIRRRTEMDPHSLGEWRVNGTLPHINAWYEAFGITPENKLYIPQEKRADIW